MADLVLCMCALLALNLVFFAVDWWAERGQKPKRPRPRRRRAVKPSSMLEAYVAKGILNKR